MNSNIQLKNKFSALQDQLKEAGQSTTAKAIPQDQARNKKKKKENLNQRIGNLQTNPIRIYQTTRYGYSKKNNDSQRQRYRSL